jgi:hypothetical protein
VLLAAVCLGSAEKEPQVRGLPTAKARKVMTAQGTAFQPALKELVEALQRGGWID